MAHRGYALHYPENTRAAIRAALAAGAKYFECDVQLTADRVPVLFHDESLDRVCGVPGSIHEFKFAELVFEVRHVAVALALWERGVQLIETFAVGELLRELCQVRDPRP